MDYNNLFKRSLISFIFILLYSFLTYLNFEYIFYLIILIYFLIFFEIYLYFIKYRIFIILYLLISLSFLINIEFNYDNLLKFNLMIVSVISFDTFSYLIGNLYGKNKILSVISPKKTLEGLVGGFIFSILFSIIYLLIFNYNFNYLDVIFVILIIISSFIGDLLESIFKRLNNLKNSSNFLSSHGGFFDRFDSFILCIIIYSLYETIV